jgi:PAS domain S-box-containing protein
MGGVLEGIGQTEDRDLLSASPLSELVNADCRFRAIMEMSFNAYYDWDIVTGDDFRSVYFDDLVCRPAGSTVHRFYAWLDLLHPEDRDRVLHSMAAAFRHARTWKEDYRLRREDGSYVWVQDRGVIVRDEASRPVRMLGTMRDITREREAALALEEAAELHRTLFRGAANPAVHVDREGRYLDANAAALDLLECSREELLTRSFWTDFPGQMAGLVEQAFDSDTRVESEVTVEVHTTPRTLIVAIVPCRIAGRGTFFCLGTDISAHKLLQQRLEDTNTALRVVLEQVNDDRLEIQKRITANVELLISPTLDRLDRQLGSRPEAALAHAVRDNLAEILRPFAVRLTSPGDSGHPLTRRELEVAGYIRMGKTTDQIAELMCLSRSAIQFHRGNIRRKLHLGRGDQQLGAALSTLMADEGPAACSRDARTGLEADGEREARGGSA